MWTEANVFCIVCVFFIGELVLVYHHSKESEIRNFSKYGVSVSYGNWKKILVVLHKCVSLFPATIILPQQKHGFVRIAVMRRPCPASLCSSGWQMQWIPWRGSLQHLSTCIWLLSCSLQPLWVTSYWFNTIHQLTWHNSILSPWNQQPWRDTPPLVQFHTKHIYPGKTRPDAVIFETGRSLIGFVVESIIIGKKVNNEIEIGAAWV